MRLVAAGRLPFAVTACGALCAERLARLRTATGAARRSALRTRSAAHGETTPETPRGVLEPPVPIAAGTTVPQQAKGAQRAAGTSWHLSLSCAKRCCHVRRTPRSASGRVRRVQGSQGHAQAALMRFPPPSGRPLWPLLAARREGPCALPPSTLMLVLHELERAATATKNSGSSFEGRSCGWEPPLALRAALRRSPGASRRRGARCAEP